VNPWKRFPLFWTDHRLLLVVRIFLLSFLATHSGNCYLSFVGIWILFTHNGYIVIFVDGFVIHSSLLTAWKSRICDNLGSSGNPTPALFINARISVSALQETTDGILWGYFLLKKSTSGLKARHCEIDRRGGARASCVMWLPVNARSLILIKWIDLHEGKRRP